jgi:AcrR family transcriptional regulator
MKKKRIGRPPGRSGADTSDRILRAARRSFGERGYAMTTFKDIAQEVGVSPAAIYPYFDSKAALYVAALEQVNEIMVALPQAVVEGKNLGERTIAVWRAFAEVYDQDPSVAGFLCAVPLEVRRHPELQALLPFEKNDLMSQLSSFVEEARRDGEIDDSLETRDVVAAMIGPEAGVGLVAHGAEMGSIHAATELLIRLVRGEPKRR